MRLVLFWLKMLPHLPRVYFSALKARKLPYEERFLLLKKMVRVVIKVLRIEIISIGQHNIPLENGFLFAANHQGTADAFIFVESCEINVTAVSKIEGMKIPFLAAWYRALEVIFFDRNSLKDAVRMSNKLCAYLKEGRNVLIFPEGTRSKSQTMREFKAGALKGAIKAKAPVIPLAFVNAYIPLDSREKKKPIKVVYCQPIHYEEYCEMTSRDLAKEVQGRIQEAINCYQ